MAGLTSVLGERRSRLDGSPVRHLDLVLVGAVVAINVLGLLMIYSATRNGLVGDTGATYYLQRQLIFVVLGLAIMAGAILVDYHRMREWAPAVYGVTIVMLALVITPLGSSTLGSQARFAVGPIAIQPSEFAKFAIILIVAAYCAVHRGDLGGRHLVTVLAIVAPPLGLVMLQPDLGTALVIGTIVLAILAVAGAKGRHLAVLALIGITGAVVAVNLGVLKPYQVDRLTAFLEQNGDQQRTTYNLEQSKTAIGNGGVTGQGLFKGSQTSLGHVPEQHTDFIFTAVGEELGFVGAGLLLVLFGIVVWRSWRTAVLSNDFFGTLLCVGVVAMLAFQIFENVGMTMGIMPITGIPLPFMSYGGSSALVSFACVGLIANVSMRRFS
ncbi:MAG: rod shape-determining protein RodA [Actinomycetes bacterium]